MIRKYQRAARRRAIRKMGYSLDQWRKMSILERLTVARRTR